MEFEEHHGLFQLRADAHRTTEAHRYTQPQSPNKNYIAFRVSDTYYMSSIESDMSNPTKLSPSNLSSAITLLYYKKQYSECLELAEKVSSFLLPRTNYEVNETAARCCVHLKKYKDALRFMAFAVKRKEVGYMVFLVKLYRLCGMLDEALAMAKKYAQSRNEDSYVWYEMGIVFNELRKLNSGNDAIIAKSAERCFRYAKHLLVRFVVAGELSALCEKKRIVELNKQLDAFQDSAGCTMFECPEVDNLDNSDVADTIIWIFKTTAKMDSVYIETVEASNIQE